MNYLFQKVGGSIVKIAFSKQIACKQFNYFIDQEEAQC